MSRLITRIENASARVTSRMTNELVFGTTIASAARITATTRTLIGWLVISSSLAPEQAGRLDGKDQRHRRVQGEIGYLRKQRLAEVVGETHQQRADRGAAEAAHAADDDDGKRQRQDFEIQP